MFNSPALRRWLSEMPVWFIAVYAAVCSFCVYFSMYAFRKPFTTSGFKGIYFLNIDYKIWLVTAQVVGYMLSKFYGIRFVSSISANKRAISIVKLILFSWFALLLFAIVPVPYNIIFLLVNGFPLGMVWGLVFSYLEGRKQTEFMGAVLAVSFIFSSGVVKSVGKWLLVYEHVSEGWMPFFAGALFVLPMLLFTWLLNHLPAPTEKDVQLRSVRDPMTAQERKGFVTAFLPGIIIIVATYVLITVLRDFRDNFANELWTELGFKNNPSIFTQTEIPVSLIVLLSMGLLILVRNNIRAFMVNHFIIITGFALALLATILFKYKIVDAVWWMVLVGTGLYLSYVPFNALYFERMIASYKIKGNVGFIMYIADAFGYLGSVAVLFIKQFYGLHLSWTVFFVDAVLVISTFGMAGTAIAAVYFRNKFFSTSQNLQTAYAA